MADPKAELIKTLDNLGYDTSGDFDATLQQAVADLSTLSGINLGQNGYDPADGERIAIAINEKANSSAAGDSMTKKFVVGDRTTLKVMQDYQEGKLNNPLVKNGIEENLGSKQFMNNLPGVIAVMENPQDLINNLNAYQKANEVDLSLEGVKSEVQAPPPENNSIINSLLTQVIEFSAQYPMIGNILKPLLGMVDKFLGTNFSETFNKAADPEDAKKEAKAENSKEPPKAEQEPTAKPEATPKPTNTDTPNVNVALVERGSVDYGATIHSQFGRNGSTEVVGKDGRTHQFEFSEDITLYELEKVGDQIIPNEVASGITPASLQETFPDGFRISAIFAQDADTNPDNAEMLGYHIDNKGMTGATGNPVSFYIAPDALEKVSSAFVKESKQELETNLGTPGAPGLDNNTRAPTMSTGMAI